MDLALNVISTQKELVQLKAHWNELVNNYSEGIHVISTQKELVQLKTYWNELVNNYSQSPFLLNSFIEKFWPSYVDLGVKPFCLAYYTKDRIVGISPPIIVKGRVLKIAKFAAYGWYEHDFIVEEEYRTSFLNSVIDFLFSNAGCNIIDISLPTKTPNLTVFKDVCKKSKLFDRTSYGIDHAVIPVNKSWREYENGKGRRFTKFFRKIEEKLKSEANWKAEIINQEPSRKDEIFNCILEIEQSSWKAEWRNQKKLSIDPSLCNIWNGALDTSRESGVTWHVAFLEINGKNIAYSLWFEYKGTAFMSKTSFNQNYRKYYPGIFLNNIVVRELFNKPEIKQIDFMTHLAFHDRWISKPTQRFRFMISKSQIPMKIIRALSYLNYITRRSNRKMSPSHLLFRFSEYCIQHIV